MLQRLLSNRKCKSGQSAGKKLVFFFLSLFFLNIFVLFTVIFYLIVEDIGG